MANSQLKLDVYVGQHFEEGSLNKVLAAEKVLWGMCNSLIKSRSWCALFLDRNVVQNSFLQWCESECITRPEIAPCQWTVHEKSHFPD